MIRSEIAAEELAAAKSERSKATQVGKIFARLISIPFPVEVGNRAGTATFLKVPLSHNRVGYHFQVELSPQSEIPEEITGDSNDFDGLC